MDTKYLKRCLKKTSRAIDGYGLRLHSPLLVKPLKDVFIKLPGSVERDLLEE